MKEIDFETDSIKAKDLFKSLSIFPSGGMAKNIIKDYGFILNGEKCFIAGKKLTKGDKVQIDQYLITIK